MDSNDDFDSTALRAARRFLGTEPSLTFIAHGDNRTYRAHHDGSDYLLRLHTPVANSGRPEFRTAAALESECLWLRALDADTALVVQRPQQLPSGEHVLLVEKANEPPLPVTLLRWIEGEHVTGSRTEDHGRKLGRLVAELHAHAKRWTPPGSFARPSHTRAAWSGALRELRALVPKGIASERDVAAFERFAQVAEAELDALGAGPGDQGLIHGDLHADNYVEHQDELHPIDFGRCGFGPWLYDAAECLGGLPAPARRSFVDAYAQSQPFDQADVRTTEAYFIAAYMESLGHNAPNPAEVDYLRRAIPIGPELIDLFLSGESFLLGKS